MVNLLDYLDLNSTVLNVYACNAPRLHAQVYDYTPADFRVKFRIQQHHAHNIMRCLDFGPRVIELNNGSIMHPEESFLIWARRLAEPTSLTTLEAEFHMDYSQIN